MRPENEGQDYADQNDDAEFKMSLVIGLKSLSRFIDTEDNDVQG